MLNKDFSGIRGERRNLAGVAFKTVVGMGFELWKTKLFASTDRHGRIITDGARTSAFQRIAVVSGCSDYGSYGRVSDLADLRPLQS